MIVCEMIVDCEICCGYKLFFEYVNKMDKFLK